MGEIMDDNLDRMYDEFGTTAFPKDYSSNVTTVYPIKLKVLNPNAVVPKMGSLQAAGYDLVAAESYALMPGEIAKIPLGFATELHPDIHCRIESRSGMALKGLAVVTGVIDADYRGEWNVIMVNLTKDVQTIAVGDRIAQAILRPTVRGHFTVSEQLESSERGSGGFGSTGAR